MCVCVCVRGSGVYKRSPTRRNRRKKFTRVRAALPRLFQNTTQQRRGNKGGGGRTHRSALKRAREGAERPRLRLVIGRSRAVCGGGKGANNETARALRAALRPRVVKYPESVPSSSQRERLAANRASILLSLSLSLSSTAYSERNERLRPATTERHVSRCTGSEREKKLSLAVSAL